MNQGQFEFDIHESFIQMNVVSQYEVNPIINDSYSKKEDENFNNLIFNVKVINK
jgi:hypothetical protein